nr:MAG TPA: hypothetical protein [Caudoviricetes sp.]
MSCSISCRKYLAINLVCRKYVSYLQCFSKRKAR